MIPESVRLLAEAAAQNNTQDIQAAVDEAVASVRELPDYDDLVADLVRNCLQELVYDARHKTNVQIKRESGYYGQAGKPRQTGAVEEAYQSVYEYRISGTLLGELRGEDLLPLVASETAIGNGHLFNASLLAWLARDVKVPADKRVRQCVTEKKLRAEFDRLKVRWQQEAARA